MEFKHIGNDVIIREWVRFVRPKTIWIGTHVMIDDFVLLSGGRDKLTEIGNYIHIRPYKAGRITLERFVTLGANSVVMPGVTIGEGATVGACSFVNKDLEPWTVNAGIPARPIKDRNQKRCMQQYEQFLHGLNEADRKLLSPMVD